MHGLRYSAKHDTFLNQVLTNGTKAPLGSGDQDVSVDTFLPSDMAAHVGLLGHWGIRDSKKAVLHQLHVLHVGEAHSPAPYPSGR